MAGENFGGKKKVHRALRHTLIVYAGLQNRLYINDKLEFVD